MSGSSSSAPPSQPVDTAAYETSGDESASYTSSDSGGDGIDAGTTATGALSGAAAGASVGGGYGALAGAAIGAGISIFGQLQSAEAQAELDRKKQAIAKEQADEIAAREQINNVQRAQASFQAQLGMGSEFAASGHEGAGVGTQLEIKRQSDLATALSDRDAAFQEHMLLEGGKLQGRLADITEQAGYFNAAGTGANFAGKLLQPSMGMTGPHAPQQLPPPPEGY